MPLVRLLVLAALSVLSAVPTLAQEGPAPMDTAAVDKDMLRDFLGVWEIRNEDGSRTCRVTLIEERGIGGRQIEVAPDCAKAFPVMDEIAAWELLEGWGIAMIDGTRKKRLRFEEVEYGYTIDSPVDGIAIIEQVVE